MIINGAVIAFIFAAAYNFWESRTQKNDFRFLLALVFLSQIIANKYQAAGVLFFLTVMGFFAQFNPVKQIKEILYNRKWRGIGGFVYPVFMVY